MTRFKDARLARNVMDKRLRDFGCAERFTPPHRGWIRAIRYALEMTAAQLGHRMGVQGSSIRSLEEKELTGGIRLSSLKRAADAMDCTLVYAFIPNESLTHTIEQQARLVLNAQLQRVRQTMALEGQGADMDVFMIEEQLRVIIESGNLWSQDTAIE